MLGYLVRTLPPIVRAAAARERSLISTLHRRVSPREIDLNLHMNQARYAEVMEVGRGDCMMRSGAWRRWRGAGVNPVVAEQRLVYRRELKPLQRYTLDSRAVAVEGRMLRFVHHLLVGDRVHTRGEVTLLFVGPDGVVPAERVAELCADLVVAPLRIEDWRIVG